MGSKKQKANSLFGILAVLLGASLATFFGRLLSVGASDIRGALGIDADHASWISTSYNMSLMFIGPFSVYLGGLLGPRRILLASANILTVVSLVMPYAWHFDTFIFLLVVAGLTAGTFYPLTLSFLLRNLPQKYLHYGIAAYAIDIVVTTHAAHSYEGWIMNALSWHWLFWTISALAPVLTILAELGIPWQRLPKAKDGQESPNWRGFLYASLGAALMYGALDQGERLDWWRSGTYVAMLTSGTFLVIAAAIRHFRRPNPLVNFAFLRSWNILLLGSTVTMFRFVLLASVVLVPSYLGAIKNYRPDQTGPVLLWLAVPQLLAGAAAVYLLGRIDTRIIVSIGFALVALGCLLNSRITTLWSGRTFDVSQLVLAAGEGLAFNGMVGAIVLELLNSGGIQNPAAVLSFGGFFQTIRLFGGELGTSFVQFFLHHRQVFHYDLLAASITAGSQPVLERTHLLSAAMRSKSTANYIAAGRTADFFAGAVSQQAFTLSIMDNFTFIAYAATACLLIVVSMKPLRLGFRQIITASAVQKTAPTERGDD